MTDHPSSSRDLMDFPPPEVLVDCGSCDGYGTVATRVRVYEHGCGFAHDDTHESACPQCNGAGFLICDAVGTSHEP